MTTFDNWPVTQALERSIQSDIPCPPDLIRINWSKKRKKGGIVIRDDNAPPSAQLVFVYSSLVLSLCTERRLKVSWEDFMMIPVWLDDFWWIGGYVYLRKSSDKISNRELKVLYATRLILQRRVKTHDAWRFWSKPVSDCMSYDSKAICNERGMRRHTYL